MDPFNKLVHSQIADIWMKERYLLGTRIIENISFNQRTKPVHLDVLTKLHENQVNQQSPHMTYITEQENLKQIPKESKNHSTKFKKKKTPNVTVSQCLLQHQSIEL